MLSDLRLGLRLFLRRPGLALAAVVSLALGIGANTAIFSVLHNVVLNPLPYADPNELVIVWETRANNAERWVAPANFVDWRRDAQSFASMAAFDEFSPTLYGRGEPERLRALGASGTFFTTLGAHAALGRTLLPSDDESGADDVAVLSHGLWNRVYGASTDVIGRTMLIDGRTYTIVGVMPQIFDAPLQSGVDVFLTGDRGVPRTFPFAGDPSLKLQFVAAVEERLRDAPGVRAVATSFTSPLTGAPNRGMSIEGRPARPAGQEAVFACAALLLAAVGTYGVMAYAVSMRTRELGVRAALGAAPGELLRMVLGQGVRLTAAAVVCGVIGGLLITGLMSTMLYEVAPRDPRTFAAVAALLTFVSLTAAWFPARRAIRINPIAALRDE